MQGGFPMTKAALFSLTGVMSAAILAGGCDSDGLSPRETQTQNYSAYTYANPPAHPTVHAGPTTENTSPAVVHAAPRVVHSAPMVVHAPIKVAVAQIGEVAPPSVMLDTMRSNPKLFSRVDPLPGMVDLTLGDGRSTSRSGWTDPQQASDQLNRIRATAADMGMDYVLILGGTMDHSGNLTPLSVLNLTIIGAFVIPSQEFHVAGKAAGSLLDAHTGQLVFTVSAEGDQSCLVPAVNSNSAPMQLMESERDELVKKLSEDVINEMNAQVVK
jgi:hypothetical protein